MPVATLGVTAMSLFNAKDLVERINFILEMKEPFNQESQVFVEGKEVVEAYWNPDRKRIDLAVTKDPVKKYRWAWVLRVRLPRFRIKREEEEYY